MGKKKKKITKKLEFSKALLVQESILIWINTIVMLALACLCVVTGYMADIPWLAVMAGLPWGAYAVSQHAYYKKAEAENTKNGIKYETVLQQYLNMPEQTEANEDGILG